MNGHLKLLLIEDSDDDARLLLRALAKEGRSVDHQRVDNAQALAQALADGAFDAVICDYNLPGFSGVEAMRMVRESGQDIPLIMVSGTRRGESVRA